MSTLGTPYYRMRKPHRVLDQVAALQSEGLPQAGIARTQDLSTEVYSSRPAPRRNSSKRRP